MHGMMYIRTVSNRKMPMQPWYLWNECRRCRTINQNICLCFMHAAVVADTGPTMQRAVNEAAMCVSLNHRNIASTYHFEFKPYKAADDAAGGLLVRPCCNVLSSCSALYLVAWSVCG